MRISFQTKPILALIFAALTTGGQGLVSQGNLYSELEVLGHSYYHLKNVCVKSLEYGGIHLFYSPEILTGQSETRVVAEALICSEFVPCSWFKFKVVPSAAPENPTWHRADQTTAVVEMMTGLTGWHVLHHFIPLTQLLETHSDKIPSKNVHFYPTFQGNFLRSKYRLGSRRRPYFNPSVSPFWRLLDAVIPPDTTLETHYNLETTRIRKGKPPDEGFIYGSKFPRWRRNLTFVQKKGQLLVVRNSSLVRSFLKSQPKSRRSKRTSDAVCYESLLLGTPRMRTNQEQDPKMNLLWDQIREEYPRKFISRALELARARNKKSKFCKRRSGRSAWRKIATGVGGRIQGLWVGPPPTLVLVNRRSKKRVFINFDEVQELLEGLGFNVIPLFWEDLRLWEQMRIARAADIMVGIHGNGLTHVLWMHPGSVLVEVYPAGNCVAVTPEWNANNLTNYGSLASFLGIHHFALREREEYADFTNCSEWRLPNVTVSIDDLSPVMEGAIERLQLMPQC